VKRVLVTGSSRGIGRAIAVRLARAGFALTLHCRQNQSEAESASAEIRSLGGQAGAPLRFDVRDRAAAHQALLGDIEAHGAYYGVVLNAGIARDNTFAALSEEDWDDVVDTSLDGFFNVLRPLVMPMVRAKQGGRVVVLSSVSGVTGNRGQVNYSAAKAGLIATEMLAGAPLEEILKGVPMQRVGTPQEVAAAVAFLLSDEAGYITRQVIGVNGGIV